MIKFLLDLYKDIQELRREVGDTWRRVERAESSALSNNSHTESRIGKFESHVEPELDKLRRTVQHLENDLESEKHYAISISERLKKLEDNLTQILGIERANADN